MKASFLFAVTFCACSLQAALTFAEEPVKIPIPPKRPAVLQASKAYIEELRARALGLEDKKEISEDAINAAQIPFPETEKRQPEAQEKQKEFEDVRLQDIMPIEPGPKSKAKAVPPPAVSGLELDDDELLATIAIPTRQDVLKAVEPKEVISSDDTPKIKKAVPIPPPDPKKLDQIIEPSAGAGEDENTEEPSEDPDTSKLISFYMQPEQIKMDESLTNFLETHALKVLEEDRSMLIEIRSYATMVSNEKYSDVRISLARALEVRSFLIERNIDPTRLKLKPMTGENKAEPDDRIDLLFIKDS